MEDAKKADRKVKELPENPIILTLDKEISTEEFTLLKRGLKPQQMEDKWFIYFEDNYLSFHRSWTGFCIYKIEIQCLSDRFVLKKALVNSQKDQYNRSDDEKYEKELIIYMINRLLLSKSVSIPLPTNLDPDKAAIYKHAIVGYAQSNAELDKDNPKK